MSEITNTATIRVVADASGVEAGLRPAVDAARRAEQAVSQVGNGAGASARNVEAAQRNIVSAIQRTTIAMEAGGRQTAAYYELLAQQRGVDPATITPYLNQLRNVEQAQTRAGVSAAQTANAMRQVPAQLTDIAVGLQAGQAPLTVLLQQGGQLRDSFGSVGGVVRGVGSAVLGLVNPFTVGAAAVGALAYAYSQGSKEADAYNRAIIMTGNVAGTSAGQLSDFASTISKTVGTQADAAQALAALAGTGTVQAQNLQQFGQVAVQVQKYIGRSVEDTAKDFAELGKSPVEASLKLTDTYHYLTSATYEQIKALQDQGKTDDAAEVAQKAYATAFANRAEQMKDQLGIIERAWMTAKDSASQAWDMFLGIGRKKTAKEELADINAQIALARAPATTQGGDRGDAAAMRQAAAAAKLPELLKQQREAQWKADKEEWDAQQAAISAQLEKAGIAWSQIMTGTLSKGEQLKQKIKQVTQAGMDAGASDADIQKAVNKVKQDFAALDNPALAQLEGQSKIAKAQLANDLADLESNYKLRITSETDYIQQKRDLQLKDIDLDIKVANQRKAIDSGKEDKSAYQKDVADIAVLQKQRQGIIDAATNSIKQANADRKKAVDDLVAGWDRTIAADTEAVAQEVALFGQSDQARQVAIAQIKLETDARKFIADQAKNGHALSQQEIDDLMAKTEARKQSTAELMNEKAAIAGAQQLLEANRAFSVQYIADEQDRAQRTLDIDSQKWRELIQNTAEGTEARKKLEEQFDQWYANRQMQPVLDRWKGVIDDLDHNFQEGFRDMLTTGQGTFSSFAKSIGNSLKTSLADALYQTFIKKYVVQIVTGFAGAISGPAVASALSGQSTGAGGASGAIGAVNAASNLYKLASGGFAGVGSAFAGGAGSLVSGAGSALSSLGFGGAGSYLSSYGAGLGAVVPGSASNVLMAAYGGTGNIAEGAVAGSSAGGTLAAGASYGAGLLGGHYVGNAIAGDYSVAHGQTVTNVATAVGAALLGPIGGVVGGVVGGLINRAFGMGDKEVTAQGIKGTLTADSLTGSNYTSWHQDGGWFRSDKNGTDTTALTDAVVSQFTQGLASIESASSGFAKSLGVSADWVSTYSKTFDLALTGDATKDQQTITDFFNGVGDEIAKKLVPNLDSFSKSGETASATLERLAGDFSGTDQVAQLLGKSASQIFGSSGIDSAKARESLLDAAGGLSTLSQEAQSFNQNFLTDAERLAPVQKALSEALSSIGYASLQTRDDFKTAVNGLLDSGAAATTEGAKKLSELLALTDAFAQVHPDTTAADAQKAATILQERQGLQDQLDELTMSSTQLLAKQRDALDDSNKALFDQVQALKSQAAAVQSMKDAASTLLGDVDSAFSVLQKVVEREKAAVQASVNTHQTAVDLLQGVSDAVQSTLNSIKTSEQKLGDRARAQSEIKADLAITKAGGQLSSDQVDSLKTALGNINQDASSQFSSYNDYLKDLYQTQSDIAQLGDVTDDSLSVEKAALKAAQDQLTALDAMASSIQAQIDELKGQSTTLLSIDQAAQAVLNAISGAKANPVNAATSAVNTAYQAALGRAPDSTGLAYWQGQAAAGTSVSDIVKSIGSSPEAIQKMYHDLLGRPADAAGLSFFANSGASGADIAAALKGSDEYKKLHPFAVGTNEVPDTMAALIHKGERIIPAADNRALMAALASPAGNASVLAGAVQNLTEQLARQQEVIERQEAALNAIAKNTLNTADHLDAAVNGDTPLATKVIPA